MEEGEAPPAASERVGKLPAYDSRSEGAGCCCCCASALPRAGGSAGVSEEEAGACGVGSGGASGRGRGEEEEEEVLVPVCLLLFRLSLLLSCRLASVRERRRGGSPANVDDGLTASLSLSLSLSLSFSVSVALRETFRVERSRSEEPRLERLERLERRRVEWSEVDFHLHRHPGALVRPGCPREQVSNAAGKAVIVAGDTSVRPVYLPHLRHSPQSVFLQDCTEAGLRREQSALGRQSRNETPVGVCGAAPLWASSGLGPIEGLRASSGLGQSFIDLIALHFTSLHRALEENEGSAGILRTMGVVALPLG
ncbi:hypothetical protein AXG93_2818s1010 [Marchantia polymorpha subsp. ruderalis]|uniref:Uncharacterized protein n=1 Tax=Marchantia polymorpha subsp. ruderalis TaxID=1480154 RepID=A0A176VX80_MARPO|nr:hypothetical protein AXG93_2818s1010 [Marchantia polymorpha subsp. ruderalis]